jgi:outer membrane protein assembly factor BamC
VRFRLPSLLLLASVFLVACSTNDKAYLDSQLGDSLELPPDLSEYDAKSRFDLPRAFSGDDVNERDKIPVLAMVESLKLVGSGDFYWLEVEEPVDHLYQLVKNFWGAEGYDLELDESVIGIMETEWIFREQGRKNDKRSWFERLFSGDDLSATQDQFKTRIERDPINNISRVYIAHRGTEFVHIFDIGNDDRNLTAEDTDNQWRFRAPEPALETEMLSRLMIYLGLNEKEVGRQMSNVKMFSKRAYRYVDSEERSPFLILKDPYQIAWNRVLHQLERLNFEVEKAVFNSGLTFANKGIITVNTKIQEKDTERGAFSFFSTTPEVADKKIALVVYEESNETTRVSIENAKGEFDTSQTGADFLNLLYNQIK